MSQATTAYQNLAHTTSALLRHTLPSIVHSSVLTSLDLTPQRACAVHTETQGQTPTTPAVG
jgi:hypothetical protein